MKRLNKFFQYRNNSLQVIENVGVKKKHSLIHAIHTIQLKPVSKAYNDAGKTVEHLVKESKNGNR